jgi:hypothetical protein
MRCLFALVGFYIYAHYRNQVLSVLDISGFSVMVFVMLPLDFFTVQALADWASSWSLSRRRREQALRD